MLATMAKVRLVVTVEEEAREALRLESTLAKKDMGEIVEDLIREHLATAIDHIRARHAQQAKAKRDRT